jgi:hypothetical protein
MLVAVEAIHLMGPSWPTGARLIVSVAAGAAIYATTVLMLARDQLARMRDIVLK